MVYKFNDITKISIIITALVIMAMTNPVMALDVNDTETANISVTISTVTMVNIDPYILTWEGLNPGDIGNATKETTNYFAIQIENIGSNNITHIWFNSSYPSSRPFGTANTTAYDAGNFVVLAKENLSEIPGGATASYCADLSNATNDGRYGRYKYPNRVEYPEVRSLVYLKDDAGNMPPSNRDYGRFRFANEEYFWMVINDTNCSGKVFHIGNESHTATQSGTVDFSGTDDVEITLSTPSEGWCYGNITGHSHLNGYGVLVQNGISGSNRKVQLVWWNKDALTSGQVGHYFYEGSNLVPGQSTAACIKVYIPYGVNEGAVKTGVLTVVVNSV